MLSFSGSLKVLVALEPCDMRKGFNGLHALVCERLGEDLRGGAIFVFSNRRHNRIKLLYWDGTGIWVMSKRLEQGCFSWPRNVEPGRTKLKLSAEALALLTDGIDLHGAKVALGLIRLLCIVASTTIGACNNLPPRFPSLISWWKM